MADKLLVSADPLGGHGEAPPPEARGSAATAAPGDAALAMLRAAKSRGGANDAGLRRQAAFWHVLGLPPARASPFCSRTCAITSRTLVLPSLLTLTSQLPPSGAETVTGIQVLLTWLLVRLPRSPFREFYKSRFHRVLRPSQ